MSALETRGQARGVGGSSVSASRRGAQPGLRRSFVNLDERPAQDRNAGLPREGSRDELRLIVPSLASTAGRQRDGNDPRAGGDVSRTEPKLTRHHAEKARDAPPPLKLQRVKANAHGLLVDGERTGASEGPRRVPAGSAESGRDTLGVRQTAPGAAERIDSRQARKAFGADWAGERPLERLTANEAVGGKREGCEPMEDVREDARGASRQGVDHVGEGRIVGSGVAAAGKCSAKVFQRRQLAQRSLHSELRHPQELQT